MAVIVTNTNRSPMFTIHRDGCRDLRREERRGGRLTKVQLHPGSIAEQVRETVYPGDTEVAIRDEHVRIEPCL